MKTLYLDCFAGISGDMFLGVLLDLGVPLDELSSRLAGLSLEGYSLTAEKVLKNGICGTKATVSILHKQKHFRRLPDIVNIINKSTLPGSVKEKSTAVFNNLAAAESKIHGISLSQVHFHEVGAIDAIIDIVGTVAALDILGVNEVLCSPLPLGAGFVECAHGVLPLPAPAALELLRGVPTRACSVNGETVTPTGAALVKTLAADFKPMPQMKILTVGYGAGNADREIPNLLRAVLGEAGSSHNGCLDDTPYTEDFLSVIEANIDDMNPEFYDYIIPALFTAGAVDVYLTPVIMKKGRSAQVVTCLVPNDKMNGVVSTLLTETTTLGVRTFICHRYKLARETIAVKTPWGQVKVKLGCHPGTGQVTNIAPEWEDCKDIAAKNQVPVKTVYDLAKAEAYKKRSP